MLLGDLGAEIIKIETPGSGDDTRRWGPPMLQPPNPEAKPESTYFLSGGSTHVCRACVTEYT